MKIQVVLKKERRLEVCIGQFMEYKGYVGSIEWDSEDKIYYGKLLNINDLVNYHADDIIALNEHYHEAVDDYLEFKRQIEKGLVSITREGKIQWWT